jgi:hypothetical protein
MSCRRRGDVEEAVFQCIGRPVFFDQAVEMVMGRVTETLKYLNPSTQSQEELRRLVRAEARSLAREIKGRFVETGILGLPATVLN